MEFWNKIWIFSPHIDDAMLSLGGFISNYKYHVDVINVFTTTNYTINGLFDIDDVTKLRKQEEEKVSSVVWYQSFFWDYLDAIIRIWSDEEDFINKDYNPKNDAVYDKLYKQVVNFIRHNRYDSVFFPSWIWNHVDHIALSQIWKDLSNIESQIYFYEDLWYPENYSDDPNAIIYEFKDIGRKIEILSLYESQMEKGTIDSVMEIYHQRWWELIKAK